MIMGLNQEGDRSQEADLQIVICSIAIINLEVLS